MEKNMQSLAPIVSHLANCKYECALIQVEKRITLQASRRWANGDSPIYMTKKRVKSPESIYLKLKRRNLKDPHQIADIAGMRVLVLYDEDLEEVVQFLVGKVIGDGCLIDLDIYGFSETERHTIRNMIPEAKFHAEFHRNNSGLVALRKETKKSAYKSIHCTFQEDCDGRTVPVELQLRTLLQDVWAELEHRLAYKQGIVDPNIYSGFSHIQSDLTTMARRLADIRKRKRELDLLYSVSLHDSLPYTYFQTEKEMFPSHPQFEEIREYFAKFQERLRHLVEMANISDAVIDEYLELLAMLKEEIQFRGLAAFGDPYHPGEDEPELAYSYRVVLEMEFAYLYILRKRFDDAQRIYSDLMDNLEDKTFWRSCYLRPILYFRQGELLLRNNESMLAFYQFDRCEQSLLELETGAETPNGVLFSNGYLLKKSLADIYWNFGSEEFIDLSWKLTREAYRYYSLALAVDAGSLGPVARLAMFNKLCWYATEKFRIQDPANTGLLMDAMAYYRQLVGFLADDRMESHATSNDYDTAGWFCYVAYRHFERIQAGGPSLWRHRTEAIADAKKHCDKMVERRNVSSFMTTSYNLHLNHAQQILLAYAEKDKNDG